MSPKSLLRHPRCKSALDEIDDVPGDHGIVGVRFKRLIMDDQGEGGVGGLRGDAWPGRAVWGAQCARARACVCVCACVRAGAVVCVCVCVGGCVCVCAQGRLWEGVVNIRIGHRIVRVCFTRLVMDDQGEGGLG